VGQRAGEPFEVTERLAKMKCDPITGMALIAMDEAHPPELRGRMFAELAQYIAPKRKAVEHSADDATLETLLLQIKD
jgi:hypothetical protein